MLISIVLIKRTFHLSVAYFLTSISTFRKCIQVMWPRWYGQSDMAKATADGQLVKLFKIISTLEEQEPSFWLMVVMVDCMVIKCGLFFYSPYKIIFHIRKISSFPQLNWHQLSIQGFLLPAVLHNTKLYKWASGVALPIITIYTAAVHKLVPELHEDSPTPRVLLSEFSPKVADEFKFNVVKRIHFKHTRWNYTSCAYI